MMKGTNGTCYMSCNSVILIIVSLRTHTFEPRKVVFKHGGNWTCDLSLSRGVCSSSGFNNFLIVMNIRPSLYLLDLNIFLSLSLSCDSEAKQQVKWSTLCQNWNQDQWMALKSNLENSRYGNVRINIFS